MYWSVIKVDGAEVIADWNHSVALKVLTGVCQKYGGIWDWSYIASVTLNTERVIDSYKYISSYWYLKEKNLIFYRTGRSECVTAAAMPGFDMGSPVIDIDCQCYQI